MDQKLGNILDPDQEEKRLRDLRRYAILDTEPEEAFDRITRIAKKVLNVPIAMISLIDEDRQWFKSVQGLDISETPRSVSFCTHVIQKDQPLIVLDATKDERFRNSPLVTGQPEVRFYAGIPLKSPAGYNIGTLCVKDTRPRQLNLGEIDILRDLARIAIDEMELRSIAMRDCLTGLLRRGSFLIKAEHEMERSRRYGTNFSILALDIDHFKDVNDRYGHAIGDLVLRTVAGVFKDNMRVIDSPARFGGEEFVTLLPETNLVSARILAERLRRTVETTVISEADLEISVTVSLGVVDLQTTNVDNVHALLNIADDRLYQAKARGRNCVMPELA